MSSTVPPTIPGPVIAAPRDPVWHIVLGIFAIVFGAAGVLQGMWGMLTPLFFGIFESMAPQGAPNPMGFISELSVSIVLMSGLLAILAGLLLLAGILLLKRTPVAPSLCVVWAVLKFFAVIANAILTYLMQQAQFQAVQSDPGFQQAPGFVSGMMQGMAIGTGVIMLLWGWALPVFMLIWLRRAKIREQVRAWGAVRP